MAETNQTLARLFQEMADVLQILDADVFKVRAFEKVARVIEQLPQDVGEIGPDMARLTQIEGIGKGSAQRIVEYLRTGQIKDHQELLAQFPPTLRELLRVPGLGPRTIGMLWRECGIKNLADLKEKLQGDDLCTLKGMGLKKVEALRKNVAFAEAAPGRVRIGAALPLAQWFVDRLRKVEGVRDASFAGSLRRGRDTIGDVDLLVAADPGRAAAIAEAFVRLGPVAEVLARGETKTSIRTHRDGHGGLQVDLRVVPPPNFGAALLYFTGSKEHNVALRERAIKQGVRLNEYGLFREVSTDGQSVVAFSVQGVPSSWSPSQRRHTWNTQVYNKTPPPQLGGAETGMLLSFGLTAGHFASKGSDLDNLADPIWSTVVNRRGWFGGARPNCGWLQLAKREADTSQCWIAISAERLIIFPVEPFGMDAVYRGPLPHDSNESEFTRWLQEQRSDELYSAGTQSAWWSVYLAFGSNTVNLGDTAGTIKHLPDSLWPIIGGEPHRPHDENIVSLVLEKAAPGLSRDETRVRIWRHNDPRGAPDPAASITNRSYSPRSRQELVAAATEEEVYRALGLQWIPPELREDQGEIALAARNALPELIETGDIGAELHAHTTASDGAWTIRELALYCAERGYHTVAVTDHSRSQPQARGLTPERLERHIEDVRAVAAELAETIAILAGSEVDILKDGTLDYPNSLLKELDIVVASPHAALSQEPRLATQRLLKAIENPYVTIMGHPTGRLVLRREGIAPDIREVVKAAAVRGVAMEINANHHRLDLRDAHARAALEAGVKLAINTDAHAPVDMDELPYGVVTARRAGATREQVVNCMGRDELAAWVRSTRRG